MSVCERWKCFVTNIIGHSWLYIKLFELVLKTFQSVKKLVEHDCRH